MYDGMYILEGMKKNLGSVLKSVRICIFFLPVIAVLVSSCGKPSDPADNYPPPGEMSLMSMEKAGEVYGGGNLLGNGNFSVWNEEATAPEGFIVPDNKIVHVVRLESRGGEGLYSADQGWSQSDMEGGYSNSFHTIIPGIQAGWTYELFVHALVYNQSTVSVNAYLLDESGSVAATWPDLVVITPGHAELQEHTARISPEQKGSLVIVSQSNKNTKFPARVCWQEWRLTASWFSDGKPATAPVPVKTK